MDLQLNPGGFIGAAVGAVLGGAIGFVIVADKTQGFSGGLISGLVACAIGGNYLWGALLRR